MHLCADMAEHPSKKARVNEPDWSAELAEAKSDYRRAKVSLDGEIQKNSPNQGYVDHLKQTMQNAQRRTELLLQRQSQQPEAREFPTFGYSCFKFLSRSSPLLSLFSPFK